MNSISNMIEELRVNFDQFSMLVELRLDELSQEREHKLEELKPLLVDPETPPGVLITAQMAALRRTYDHDLLQKVLHYLTLCRETLKKMDRLPRPAR